MKMKIHLHEEFNKKDEASRARGVRGLVVLVCAAASLCIEQVLEVQIDHDASESSDHLHNEGLRY